MLEFLRGSPKGEDAVTWSNSRWRGHEPQTANDRRFRLFACACCRRIWCSVPEPCDRDAVGGVEDYLEGRVTDAALGAAFVASSAVEWREDGSGRRSEPGYWAVKYLGRGFYKMTAGASALMVASPGAVRGRRVRPGRPGRLRGVLLRRRRGVPAPVRLAGARPRPGRGRACHPGLPAQVHLRQPVPAGPLRPLVADECLRGTGGSDVPVAGLLGDAGTGGRADGRGLRERGHPGTLPGSGA